MKLRTALTVTALASLMALPFAANAQARFGHTDQRGGSSQSQRGNDQNRKDDQKPQRNTQSQRNHGSDNVSRGNDKGNWNQGPARGHVPEPSNTRGNDRRDDNRNQDRNRQDNDDRWQSRPVRNDDRDWSEGRRDRDDYRYVRSDHNDWRDILYVGGFFADLDLLSNDDTICFSGYDGALYPVWQYDNDCRSRDAEARARAELFARTFFYRDGHRFERKLVTRHGDRYYQFVRVG